MVFEKPEHAISLKAGSVAEDLFLVTMVDLYHVINMLQQPINYRLIGGQCVSLHVRRWSMNTVYARQTTDSDIGIEKSIIAAHDTVIEKNLHALGYVKKHGNMFCRVMNDVPVTTHTGNQQSYDAILELLIPAHTSRPRSNVPVGNMNTTEVPGLGFAMQRPAVVLEVFGERYLAE